VLRWRMAPLSRRRPGGRAAGRLGRHHLADGRLRAADRRGPGRPGPLGQALARRTYQEAFDRAAAKAGLPPELPPASWNRARTALDNARTASRHSPVTKPRAELVLIPGRHRSRPIVRKR
jgi:hypothetical protein